MTHFLRKLSPNFRDNRSLVDDEKLRFYRSKEATLAVGGGDKSAAPARGEVHLSNKSYYVETNHVQLANENGGLFLKVQLDNFTATFSNKDHQLLNTRAIVRDSEFEMELRDYILFDGTHFMPKFIIIKRNQVPLYFIETLKLAHESKVRSDQKAAAGSGKENSFYDFLF